MGWIGNLVSTIFISLALVQSVASAIVPDSYIVKYTQTPVKDFSTALNVEDYYPHIDAYWIKANSKSFFSLLQNDNIKLLLLLKR